MDALLLGFVLVVFQSTDNNEELQQYTNLKVCLIIALSLDASHRSKCVSPSLYKLGGGGEGDRTNLHIMLCVSLEMEADVDILQIHQRLKNACLAVRILSIKCLFWSCCYHLSLGLKMKLEGQNFRRFPPWTSSGHMVFLMRRWMAGFLKLLNA